MADAPDKPPRPRTGERPRPKSRTDVPAARRTASRSDFAVPAIADRRTLHVLLLAVGGLSLLVLVLAGLWWVQKRHQANALVRPALAELAAGRYDQAVVALRIARGRGAEAAALAPLMDKALAGQAARRAIDGARGALAAHHFDDARLLLQGMPPGSPLAAEAAALSRSIEPSRARWLYEQSERDLEAGRIEAARARQPTIAALDASLGKRLSEALAERAAAASLAAPKLDLKLDRPRPQASVREALAPTFARFDRGAVAEAAQGFARAAANASDASLAAEARALSQAAHNCAEARAAAGGDSTAALETAVRACVDVDPASPTVAALCQRLARAYVASGTAALTAGAPLAALSAFRKAQALDPGASGAAAGIEALRRAAPALAAKARAAPGTPAARDTWRALAAALPAADPLRAEALAALAER